MWVTVEWKKTCAGTKKPLTGLETWTTASIIPITSHSAVGREETKHITAAITLGMNGGMVDQGFGIIAVTSRRYQQPLSALQELVSSRLLGKRKVDRVTANQEIMEAAVTLGHKTLRTLMKRSSLW